MVNIIKKIFLVSLAYVCLAMTPALGQDARDFYNLGLKSSLTYKKIEYFTKALQMDPNLVEVYEKRAIQYYFRRWFDNAIQDLTKVVELNPHNVDAYFMLGRAYLWKGKGLGIKGEISNLIYNVGKKKIPEYRKLLDRAIESFGRAIELDPQLSSAYSYRGVAYRIKGMTEEALRDSTMAIGLHGDRRSTAKAYATRARIYQQMGFHELSKADFHKSIELDPYVADFPPLHVPLIYPGFGNTSSPKPVGRMGLLGIIILIFVVIFKMTLPAPKKRDKR
jgi:tetratricopeptide (TPR) repeat protein